MRVLLVISQLPYPPDTGAKIRTYNLIKRLSKEHSITLVTFGDYDREKDKILNLKEFCEKIELMPKKSINNYIFAFKNLFSKHPYSVCMYYSKDMVNKLDELIYTLNPTPYSLIHCDSVQMSLNVLKLKTSIPKVLTEHNIESQILKRLAQNESNIFKKIYFYIQYLKLKKYEIFACKQFDHIIAVSEEDKKFLVSYIAKENISIIPNGVDCSYFLPTENGTKPCNLVFTGSMDWLPNIDAVEYFYNNILPLIWQKNTDVRFYVVGRNPAKNIIELGKKDTRIIITGTIDDIRPYMADSSVYIAPLRIGGGTRLKILEAMAMKKTVVSTSIGAEGLEITPDENIILADEPQEFANRVIELLEDSELRKNLENKGRKLVEAKYDWTLIADRLENVWETVGAKK